MANGPVHMWNPQSWWPDGLMAWWPVSTFRVGKEPLRGSTCSTNPQEGKPPATSWSRKWRLEGGLCWSFYDAEVNWTMRVHVCVCFHVCVHACVHMLQWRPVYQFLFPPESLILKQILRSAWWSASFCQVSSPRRMKVSWRLRNGTSPKVTTSILFLSPGKQIF